MVHDTRKWGLAMEGSQKILTDLRDEEWAHSVLCHYTEPSSQNRTRKGRRDHIMCCFQFQLPSEVSPTFWQRLGHLDIFEDFLYGYPDKLHASIQGHLGHALSLKSSYHYSEQCLRKKIIHFQLLILPILAVSEQHCLAWASVELWPF